MIAENKPQKQKVEIPEIMAQDLVLVTALLPSLHLQKEEGLKTVLEKKVIHYVIVAVGAWVLSELYDVDLEEQELSLGEFYEKHPEVRDRHYELCAMLPGLVTNWDVILKEYQKST